MDFQSRFYMFGFRNGPEALTSGPIENCTSENKRFTPLQYRHLRYHSSANPNPVRTKCFSPKKGPINLQHSVLSEESMKTSNES